MKYGKKFDSIGSFSWDRDNFFRAILAVLFSWCLIFYTSVKDLSTTRVIFGVCICQKIAPPIDNLHVAVGSFSKYAMNLDHTIGHDSFNGREQSVCNKKY